MPVAISSRYRPNKAALSELPRATSTIKSRSLSFNERASRAIFSRSDAMVRSSAAGCSAISLSIKDKAASLLFPFELNHEGVLVLRLLRDDLANLITSRHELLKRRLLFVDARAAEGDPDFRSVRYYRAAHCNFVEVTWPEIRSVFG